jgi:putative colanic acid biosynthesis UDP-glucose lipid carrier transferase
MSRQNASQAAMKAVFPAGFALPAAHSCQVYSAKPVLDVVLAGLLLVLLSPMLALVSLAILLDSRGPLLFWQTRTGLNGRIFPIFKFRSMHVVEDGADVRQVVDGDIRVTRVGRIIRKLSLDELPQLLNVIAGDMSLVGPRPHALVHDEYYGAAISNYAIRQQVKPGITGWAQVNGARGATPTLAVMQRRVEFDAWYVVHANFALDLKILARTPLEVVRPRNTT